jgi:hypothetical protein
MSYVMEPMCLATGGRWLVGKGGYVNTCPAPLIQVAAMNAGKVHVMDIVSAGSMVHKYKEKDKKVGFLLDSRRGTSPGHKAVIFGPADTVLVGVHRLLHFVSMVVENLGALDGTAARTSVADSLPSPVFNRQMHDALRIACREIQLIGKEHEVELFGLALPQQDRCDCAFYMLTYMATVLTGCFLQPALWGFLTRLMRCWRFFFGV